MSSDTNAEVKIDLALVKLNAIAEPVFAGATAKLLQLGVPAPQLATVALTNLLWLCDHTGNPAAWAKHLRAAADILERKEADHGR